MYIFLMNFWGQKVRKMISVPELQNNKPGVFKYSYPTGHATYIREHKKCNSFTCEGEKSPPVKYLV